MKCEILSSEIIFHEFLKVEKTSVRWEKFEGGMGSAGTRYVVRRGDSVGVVPVCSENGRIILVNQFRFPAVRSESDGYLWEIPAGMVDGDEDTVQTATRELFEEIGLQTDIVQIQVNRSQKMPKGKRFKAQNPVWIISGQKEKT